MHADKPIPRGRRSYEHTAVWVWWAVIISDHALRDVACRVVACRRVSRRLPSCFSILLLLAWMPLASIGKCGSADVPV